MIHAFQKKAKSGIKTPKTEVDLIHERQETLEGAIALNDELELVRGSDNPFRDQGIRMPTPS